MTEHSKVIKFKTGAQPGLKLKVTNIDVVIESGDEHVLEVDLTGISDKVRDAIKVEQDGNIISVRTPGVTDSFDQFFSSFSRIADTVFSPDDLDGPLLITAPPGTELEATISGKAALTATCRLGNVELQAKGSVRTILNRTKDLDARLIGSGSCEVHNLIGSVNARCTGATSLRCDGAFHGVKVKGFGACQATFHGEVSGNFIADAAGACEITHKGNIMGKVETNTAGASTIGFSK
ncbi:MAG: hypothetical protein U5N86_05220 [Planctomycetota bacterium]|nr:hypothetical protein [Planctomycetota bacterium]